jgi:hypothetical protein
MSDFHGGFFIEKVDGSLLEPVRRAMRDYLFRETKHGHRYAIAFTARRGAPVMRVAVRNEDADGRGEALFHERHGRLGADIARACGATVHAYFYENQAGSEGVTTFGPDGAELANARASWDDFAEREGFGDDDEGMGALLAALPLGRLAHKLNVERGLLEQTLPYATPELRVGLVGDVPRVALTEYLRSAPRERGGDPPPWPKQRVFVARPSLAEMDALCGRLDVSLGTLLCEALELAKFDLHGLPPSTSPTESPLAPPTIPPRILASVLDVPEEGLDLDDLATGDHVGITVALPPTMGPHLRALAERLDRSISWVIGHAWRLSRARLHGARRHGR